MPYFTAQDKTKIYYYDWGTGKPVILIHGWPLTSASWEHQARFLAENGFRVIAYDRRGFGRSDWAYSGYDYDTLANDLKRLMDELDLKETTLVGFSMGGGEVSRYLSQHGAERVSKAVLIASVPPYLLKTTDNPNGVDKEVFDGIVDAIKKDRAAFLKDFAPKFYGCTMKNHTVSQPFLDFFCAMAMTGSPKATTDLVRAWSETDFRNDLKRNPVPTLIIHGTNDATVPIEISGKLSADLIPNSTFLEYEGQPHGLISTDYKKLNKDLLRFLNS